MNQRFHKQIPAFEQLLERIDIDRLPGSGYAKRYLQHLLLHKRYFLELYADVLDITCRHNRKKPEDSILVDYGCGNGLLGIFASFAGFYKVYLVDIDPSFTEAAASLSDQLGVSIAGCIHGDFSTLSVHTGPHIPDVICGTDVIEHIYNLEEALSQIKQINPAMIMVFSTAANTHNPVKKRRLIQLQYSDEYQGGRPEDSVLSGDVAHEPYFQIRKNIIRKTLPQVNDDTVASLAKATRGKNEQDIIMLCKKFQESGQLPQPPDHPSNTCHPITGSWTERLLTVDQYKKIFRLAGFGAETFNGRYDTHKPTPKNLINSLLNRLIPVIGITIAPYIILAGFPMDFNES